MFYIAIFVISLFLLFLGLKINNKNKIVGKILIIIGLLIPCIIAGLRHYTIGTDTGGYVLNLYKVAQTSSSFNSFHALAKSLYNSSDIAYLLITYVFGRFNISFQLMLFLFEFLIIIPFYAALKKVKIHDYDIVLGMAIIYLVLYNQSLNMIRQAIAIAIFLLSFAIFMKAKDKKSIVLSLVLLIVAIEFHDTVLYVTPLYVLYMILNSKKLSEKSKTIIVLTIVVLAAVFLAFHRQILLFIGNSGIYPKALWYLNRYSRFDIDYTGTMKNFFIMAVIFYKKDFFIEKGINYKFGILVAILNIIIAFLGTFISYSERIAYYFMYLSIIFYVSIIPKQKKQELLLVALTVIVFIGYWIITILLNNGSQTLPYKLFI